MKMKFAIGILTGAILLGGAGTFAFAQVNEDTKGNEQLNFEQMKPHMEEVHPDLSTQELEQMYNSCHTEGEGGMMDGDTKNTENMMNNI
ncbi:hypothetical protein [Niallia oryzisoli]|uniref:hypothetical protein n=1 Tax=Niallia oryzisoli TaxID=1737571 RepID=UPI003736B375